jgi:hypothetical protein
MIVAKDQFVTEYQTLLAENESLATVARAAKLTWDVLGGRITPKESGLSFEPSASNAADSTTRIQSSLPSLKPRDAYDIKRWQQFVSAHPVRNREHRRLRAIVVDVATALTVVPTIGSSANFSSARCSLLIDSCLLLAHHAYFALLPKLDDQRYAADRMFLLSAFHDFADSSSEPADRFAMLALYFDAVDKPQQASESRRAALAATAADAHDFLTVLQSFWTSLVERGMLNDALELLLQTYPRVARRDLDEVGELIRQTFRQATAVNGHSVPRHKTAKRRKN